MSVIQPAAKVKDAKMLSDAKPYLSHNPTDPAEEPWAIVLLASDIAEITPYLGLNVANREDLITRIKMLSSLRLDNTDVIFEPAADAAEVPLPGQGQFRQVAGGAGEGVGAQLCQLVIWTRMRLTAYTRRHWLRALS